MGFLIAMRMRGSGIVLTRWQNLNFRSSVGTIMIDSKSERWPRGAGL